MVLTEKEMATIEDLHTQELSCVEKYKRYERAKACGVSGTGHERQRPIL